MKQTNPNQKKRIIKKNLILLMVLVLVLTGLTQVLSQTQTQDLLYLSVDKPSYEIEEKITMLITAENLEEYELSISSENNYYKYSGELSSSIDYYPKEPGLHRVELTEKTSQNIVDSVEFMVGSQEQISEANKAKASIIKTDKQEYLIGEEVKVIINLPDPTDYKLYYGYEGLTQRYMGELTEISFVPRGIGTNKLILTTKNNNIIEEYSFEVIESIESTVEEAEPTEPEPTEPEPVKPEQTKPESEPAVQGKAQEKSNLKSQKKHFKLKEDVEFEFNIEAKEKIIAVLIDAKGEIQDILPEIEQIDNNNIKIRIPNQRAIRPGSYKLRVEATQDGETIVEEQEFLWGVLAINTHKSIYLPGEEAFIGIAVLDDSGHMVCDANLTLEITAPGGSKTILSTAGNTIIISPECEIYGVTNLPDYYTYYDVSNTGNYTLNLTAETSQGIRSMTDQFIVQNNVEFDVERNGATRIFPWVPYKMNFTIKANQNYNGPIREYVPVNFTITPQAGLTVSTSGDAKILTWNKNLVQGQTYTLSYEFDAPDLSPYLFTLGALEIGTWSEARNWMIASDGTMVDDSNTENDTVLAEGDGLQIDTQYDNYKNDVYWVALDVSGTKILDDGCVGGADFYIASTDLTNCAASADSCTWDGGTDHVIVDTPNSAGQTDTHIYWYLISCAGSVGTYTFQCDDDGGTDPVVCDAPSNTVNVVFVSNPPVVVSLDNPGNDSNITTSSAIDFNFTATDDLNFTNCTLYTNVTSSWVANESITSVINNSENRIQAYMPDGDIIWNIRCWDNDSFPQDDFYSANYSLHIDTTGPTTTLDNPINGTNTSNNLYTVNATATDATGIDTVTFMYRQNESDTWKFACNDTDGTPYNCTWNTTNLIDGKNYQIRAYANDTLGNIGNNDTHKNITLDKTSPTSNQPGNSTHEIGSIATIGWFLYDNIAPGQYIIYRNATIQNATTTWNNNTNLSISINTTTTGTWNYTIWYNDTLGNIGTTTNQINITVVDTTGPTTTLDNPDNQTNITTKIYTVNASVTDLSAIDTVTFLYRQNNTDTWKSACNDTDGTPYNCTWNTTNLADGTNYQIRAYANDTYSNTGNNDTHTNITIDNTPPTSNNPNDASYNSSSIATIGWYLYDNIAPGQYIIYRNATIQNATTTWNNNTNLSISINTTTTGTWNYTIWYNDTFNNTGIVDAVLITILDVTGPTTTLDNPDNQTNISTNLYTVNATATDDSGVDTVTFLYRQNATATWQSACNDNTGPTYNCTWNTTNLADGKNYQLRVYSNDTLGNIGNNDTHYNITLDKTPPTSNNPNDASYNSSSIATIGWYLYDNIAPGRYIVYRNSTIQNDTTTWANNTNLSISINTTTVGTWNYTIWYNDSLGNNGTTDTVIITILDVTGPVTTLDNPNNGTNISTNLYTVNASITDLSAIDTMTVLYRQNATDTWKPACNDSDGTTPYNCTWNTTNLPSSQTYEIRAYANDTYGNKGNNDTHINITIDKTPPTSNQPGNSSHEIGSIATIGWYLYDNIAPGYYIIYRNATIQNATTTWNNNTNLSISINTTTTGTWNYTIWYNDTFNNTGITNQINITIVDTTGPTTTLDNPDNLTEINTNLYTVNATVTDLSTIHTVTFLYRQNATATWQNACNDSDGTAPYNCTWNTTNLADGTNFQIRAYANDTYGNIGNNDTHINITLDRTLPTSNNPSDVSREAGSNATIGWYLYDNIAPGQYIIYRNATIQNSSTTWTNNTNLSIWINTTTLGTWNYTIWFNDSAGNTGTQDQVTITIVDTTAPLINSVSNNPSQVHPGENVTITANITDYTGVSNAWIVEILGVNYTMIQQEYYGVNWTEDFSASGDWATWGTEGAGIAYVNDAVNCIDDANDDCLNADGSAQYNLTKQSDIDMSDCKDDTAWFYIGSVVEGGNIEADDCMEAHFSNDSGGTWSGDYNIFCNDDPASTANITIPNQYLTANFRIMIEEEGFADSVEDAWLDGFEIYCTNEGGPDIWELIHNTTGEMGIINYTVYANDTSSNNATPQSSYYTVNLPPNVTSLDNPGNQTNQTSNPIDFNFTATDETGFTNCTLYTNASVTFTANESTTIVNNNSVTNISAYMPEGNIIWNIICWDNSTEPESDWYEYNYTIYVDTTGPTTTLDDPAEGTNITTNTTTVNASVTDATEVDTVTFLYRRNNTDTWKSICNDNTGPTYNCTWNLTSLPDISTYEVRAYANDTWGHKGDNNTNTNITIDRYPPGTTLLLPATNETVPVILDGYTVNATAVDNGTGVHTVKFEYRENASATWKSICQDNTSSEGAYSCVWDMDGLTEQSTYQVRANANDSLGNNGTYDTHTGINITKAPDIENVSATPQKVGVGQLVTINADIYDDNGIDTIQIIITQPNNQNITSPMASTGGTTYEYNFTPFQTGTYKYTIKVNDSAGFTNILDPYFYVYVDATIHVMLENTSYGGDEDVELITGYVNWSADQEGGVQNIKAQGQTIVSFTANGGSIIPGPESYDVSDGSYSDTTSDNGVYYAVGTNNGPGGGSADDLQAYINLSYNISSIGEPISSIHNLIFNITFCHTDDVAPPITCGADMGGTANNPVNFDIYNFDVSGWETKGNFNQDEASSTEQILNFSVSSTLPKYINNYIVHGRWEADATLGGSLDASFAMDYSQIFVNYTKLDNEGTYSFVNYTSIDGDNYTQLSAIDVVITVSYYNASGSLQAGNELPNLQVTAFTGSGYTNIGNCDINESMANVSTAPANCTVTIIDSSILDAWKTNSSIRRIQVRGINFDEENGEADEINFTDVKIKYLSGSLIPNHNNYTLSGYLIMSVLKNESGSYTHITTVINDTNGGSIRNISEYGYLDIGSIWNATGFNTNSYDPGSYVVNASFTDENGTVIKDNNGVYLNGYDSFNLEYLSINITNPENNSVQDAQGFDVNATLSYSTYPGSGTCYYSIDGGANRTLENLSSTSYTNTTTDVYSIGNHTIIVQCNDSRGYWFSSDPNYFNTTDQRGPNVTLIEPIHNEEVPNGSITFLYNVTDIVSGIQNCTLILDYTDRRNTSYNLTEDTTLNFTVTGLTYETHVWQVECYDNSSNNNKGLSATWTFLVGNDSTPPDVTLDSPIPSYNTTNPKVSFNYTVVDTESDIANCSLIINGSINQTNSSIETGEEAVNSFNSSFGIGSYNWSVNCTDIRDNIGASEWRIFTVQNDTDYPIIKMVSPGNNSVDTDGDITFSYNVTDASSDIFNCSLIINNEINQTNTTITEGATQYFYLYDTGDGSELNWSVNCTDASANLNLNASDTWNVTVNVISSMKISVDTNKNEYQAGEIAQVNTTVTDDLGSALSADVITDIIQGNATVTWWNTSWKKRMPLTLTSAITLSNVIVEVNISGLGGYIQNCQEEIRIIETGTDNEFVSENRTVTSGDDSNYCVVRFRANITGGTNNTNYYAYYNNSAATDPSNNITRQNLSAQRIADAGSLIAGAGGYDVSDGSYSNTTTDNSVYYAVGRDNGGGETDALQAYINISYNSSNVSEGEIEQDNIISLNFSINYCHTNDISAPITCGSDATGTAQNPVNAEVYNFNDTSWDLIGTFTQDDAASTEQDSSFYYTTTPDKYVNDNNKIWVRYETDFTHGSNQDTSFAIDHATVTITYREKIYNSITTVNSGQVFVSRQTNTSIASGLGVQNFNTSTYNTGAHSAVSKANYTGYQTNFNYTFFNVVADTSGPIINLVSPADDNYSLVRNINFTYTANDIGHVIASCELILNGAVNQTNTSVIEGETEWFYVTDLPDGQYNWSVNCTDSLGYENISTETRNLTIGGDLVAPVITLYKPSNTTPFLSGANIVFNYSATDALNGLASCELIINGSVFNTTSTPPEDTVLNFSISSLGDGNYSWIINCTDSSSNSNEGSSELRNFSIGPDGTGPTVQLKDPENGAQKDNGNVTLTYNITDVLSDIKNCTIWVFNSSYDQVYTNTSTNVIENTNQYFYTFDLNDGLHYWNMSCWDNYTTPNQGFSQTYNFTIATDTEAPTVALVSPPDEYQDVDGDVIFYFNVTETITSIANCSLIFNDSIYTTINASDITNGETNNFTTYNLSEATYFWKVNCTDTALLGANTGTSAETWNLTVKNDTEGPQVSLYNPPPGVQDTDGEVNFEFSATDYASEIQNCTLVFNGSNNYTWTSVNETSHYNHTLTSLQNGNYSWYVNCTDNSTNYNWAKSETRNLSIGTDVTAPTISLISPSNNTKDTDGNITFAYNVTDYASNVTNCTLIINGSHNITDNSITEDTTQYFYLYNVNIDTELNWSINCTDDAPVPNTGFSETRNISIVLPKAMITKITTENASYIQGETVPLTANITNGSGSLIDGNINIDVIRGWGKAPWWNTNWGYRVPVTINTTNFTRRDALIEKQINFTSIWLNDLELGNYTLDTNSIRVVEWEADNDTKEVPSYFEKVDGFNATTNAVGIVTWQMDGATPSNTNRTYHVYFDANTSTKSAPDYTSYAPNLTFVGSTENINYNGAATTADYVIISSGQSGGNSFALQFSDGDDLANQQHIKRQGAGAIWNITINSTELSNQNSSFVPLSVAFNNSMTTDSTSSVQSAKITRIDIPGTITSDTGSNASLNYTIWYGTEYIYLRANLTVNFSVAENNNYAFENTWFAYLFDDDNNTGWTNYINKMESASKNQTHDYQGVQENTYNTFYAGDWYREYSSTSGSEGSVGLVVDVFKVNGASATKGVVTFDDNNDGEETDMVGFSDNGNPDIIAGDTYEIMVWIIISPLEEVAPISDFRNDVLNPPTVNLGHGHEFITRSSGTTTGGFYYYNFSTSGKETGNYSAISGASQDDYVNASGYVWFNITEDTIPPIVNLTSPSGWLNYSDINFTYYVEEGGSGIDNCTLYINGSIYYIQNGSNITDYANNTINVSNLGDGNYNWTVVCYDNNNNNGTDTELNITIDTTSPNVSIVYPSDGAIINDATPLFNFTINDSLSDPNNYTVYVNGVANGQSGNASNASIKPINISTLSDGIYNITIKGTDQAGNSANDTIEITIDINAPVVNFENQTGTWYNTSTPEVFFNMTDSIDNYINYSVYVNSIFDQSGNASNATSTNITLGAIGDGIHNITIQATDNATNAANYSIIIYVDTTAPTINLTYPDNNSNFTQTSIDLNFTVKDNVASSVICNLTLDDTLIINNTAIGNNSNYSVSASNLTEATHYWNVTCWDNISNTNTSVTNSFNIFIAPIVNLSRPEDNNFSNNANQILYFNVSDDTGIANCSLYLNGQWNTSKTTSQITNNDENNFTVTLGEGEYNWSVKCFDNTSQQVEGNSENWTITLDLTAPTPTITTANYTWFNTSTPDINFTITDNYADPISYTLYVNESANASGSVSNNTPSGDLLSDLNSNASYRITLGATDDVGNSIISSSIIIYVDTEKPNINLSTPSNGQLTSGGNVEFNFTITDNMAEYTMCNLTISDGAYEYNINATNNTIQNITKGGYTTGIYYWNVTCIDLAGNKNTSATWNFTVDSQAPTVNFENLSGTRYNDSTPEIFFNITDNFDTNINYTLYINGTADQTGNITNATSTSENLSSQADGSYNITIQATDDANNTANYSIIIYIDTTAPTINLTYPDNNSNFTTRNMTLNFTASDNMGTYLTCNLTLDGSVNRSNFQVQTGQEINTTVTWQSEGTHYWNVTCWDNVSNINTSETRLFNVYIAPIVNLSRPTNGNISNNPTQIFYFNVSDETGIENCSIWLNGQQNETKSGTEITNNTENNITVYGLDGEYNWSIRCFDNTSYKTQGDSENWTITIDLVAPTPTITTANYTWFNTSTPTINFLITDNLADPITYTFYVNGSSNASGSASNNSASSDNLDDLGSNSSFLVQLYATDDAGNTGTSQTLIIYVDTEKPSINLSAPSIGQELNDTTAQFNFTATDNMVSYTICNLTISNGINETNINATNNTLMNITKTGFSSGLYYWNVTCIDLAGNKNTSSTWNFTVLSPDLVITSANISFNDSSPEEDSNITIFANIFNLGGSPAYNVTVQFWKGDPDNGGTQINGNKTISTLSNAENFTLNVTYNVSIGNNNIFVVVDPPTATNGTITEENESNNKANTSFNVELYQVYAGNTSGVIDMEKQSINISLFQWNVSNTSGSNIFVTDIEANPDFTNLQAISRDTSNNSVTDDFEEIDSALGTTNYTDSINTTFTTSGNPKETQNFTVFTNAITNVPVINSTNTSNFKTGIIWDAGDGHTEYNGTQDLIFITETNQQQQGSQGIYDFEIKIPALLRNYNAAGNSISFYAELK